MEFNYWYKIVSTSETNHYNTEYWQKKKKDKSHILILLDPEKAFDKVQHPSMIETLKTLRRQENFLAW